MTSPLLVKKGSNCTPEALDWCCTAELTVPAHLLSLVTVGTGHRTAFILVVGTFLATWHMHCLSFLSSETFIQLCIKTCCPIFLILGDREMLPSQRFLVVSCKITGSNYWIFFLTWVSCKAMNAIHKLSYWLQFLSHFPHNLICFYPLCIRISFPFPEFGCSLPSLGC